MIKLVSSKVGGEFEDTEAGRKALLEAEAEYDKAMEERKALEAKRVAERQKAKEARNAKAKEIRDLGDQIAKLEAKRQALKQEYYKEYGVEVRYPDLFGLGTLLEELFERA